MIAICALVASVVLGGGSLVVAIVAETRARRVEKRQDAAGIDWALSIDTERARLTITNRGVDNARDVTASVQMSGVSGSARADFVKAMGGVVSLDFPAVLQQYDEKRAQFEAEGVHVPVTLDVLVNMRWRMSGKSWHYKQLRGRAEHWV